MGMFDPPIVETGRTRKHPDLQPLHLKVSPERAFSAVSSVAGKIGSWTVVKVDPVGKTLLAEAKSRPWGTDDVVVRVEAEADGSVVHMRSSSRRGMFDFGANAARIRKFLKKVAKAAKTSDG
jgi:uncharacterized protein (DUF1499 family)